MDEEVQTRGPRSNPRCKACNSANTIKQGKRNGKKRYKCKDCEKNFYVDYRKKPEEPSEFALQAQEVIEKVKKKRKNKGRDPMAEDLIQLSLAVDSEAVARKICADEGFEKVRELTFEQRLFCRLYTCPEFYAHGTVCYAAAFNLNLGRKGSYNTAKSNAHRLLTNAYILGEIKRLLDEVSLSEATLLRERAFLVAQNADLSVKERAISNYENLHMKRAEHEIRREELEVRKEELAGKGDPLLVNFAWLGGTPAVPAAPVSQPAS